jgi:N-acetylneuraminic acid mutarotase/chromosome segregation ATPase
LYSSSSSSSIGVEWRRIEASKGAPPLERASHACSLVGNKLYIYGGRPGLTTWNNAIHSFNFEDKSWNRVPATAKDANEIPALVGHSMTRVGTNDLYIFGGRTGLFSYSSDLYRFDTETETFVRVQPNGSVRPSARQGHTAIAVNNQLYIHGGSDGARSSNDAFAYNPETNEWRELSSSTVAAEGAKSISFDEDGLHKIVVFGGNDGKEYTTKIRVYTVESDSWTIIDNAASKPRSYHNAIRIGNYVYLYGGLNKDHYLSSTDIFALSDKQWVKKPITGEEPTARQGHCAVSYGGTKVVIWGGSKGFKSRYNDLWVLDTQPQVTASQGGATSSDDQKKDLSELIEDALTRVSILVNADQDDSSTSSDDASTKRIEQEVNEFKSRESTLEESFRTIPDMIKQCHDLEQLYLELSSARNAVYNVTSTLDIYYSDIINNNKQLDDIKAELKRRAEALRNKLNELKTAEQRVREQRDASDELRQVADRARERVNQLEKEINSQNQIVDISRSIDLLKGQQYGYQKTIDEMTRVLSKVEKEYAEDSLFENTKTEELSTVRAQIASIQTEIRELDESIVKVTRTIEDINDKLKKWENLANEAGGVKEKLLSSISASHQYTNAKSRFLQTLKNLEEDIPEDVEKTEDEANEQREKDLKWLDDFIAEQKKKLYARKSNQGQLLEQHSNEVKRKRAKLRELEDYELQINIDLEKARARINGRDTNKSKYETQKQEAETHWKKINTDLVTKSVELATVKNQLEEAQKQFATAKEQSDKATVNYNAQRSVEDAAIRDLSVLKNELSDLYKRLVDYLGDAHGVNQKIQHSRRLLSVTKRNYEEQRVDIDKFSRDLNEKIKEINTAWAARYEALNKKYENCQSENEVLKAELALLKKHTLTTTTTTTTQQVETTTAAEQFEVADLV